MRHKGITLLLGLLMISSITFSQDENEEVTKEKLEQLKKEYIQSKLELSDAKLTEFSALYEAYEAEKSALKKKSKAEKGAIKLKKLSSEEIDDLEEEEAMRILEHRLERQEKLLMLEKSYQDKFTSTITAKQLLQYRQAERDFRKDLLKMMMEERKEGREDYSKRLNNRMRGHMRQMREMRKMR